MEARSCVLRLSLLGCPDSLRFFRFELKETPFNADMYCVQQFVPQRDGKDIYHPFLVSAFAIDGGPPRIACCNAARQTHPDPALVQA